MIELTNALLQQAYRYAMSLVDNHEEAKDIVHAAYTKLLEKDDKLLENPQGYLLRCVRNTFIDQKRADIRRTTIFEQEVGDTIDISVHTLESIAINQQVLVKLWSEFSFEERELLYLWAVEEYTVDEISQLTDIPRGTLLSRIYRIRQKVEKKALHQETYL
ncbi:MAG: sigma-70 family RNA polymerase sigma factor [Cellvibrionaceae bacterium]|nr:sigma-70 family RNA polymerase sigma factor [Cellvibrionaceae bacterium]